MDELLADTNRGSPTVGFPAAEILARWSRIFAGGDRAALCRRLGWDGLDEARVAAALEHPPLLPPPPWLAALPEILAPSALPHLPAGVEAVPFAEVLLPWVEHARGRVVRIAPLWRELVAPPAREAAERHLLEQLSAAAAAALYGEFHAFRAARRPPALPAEPASRRCYLDFVAAMRGSCLARWLAGYPVLAKHLCLLSWQWSDAMAELANRLARDLPAIGDELAGGRATGPVVHLKAGLSDRHEGGRQVAALRFEAGVEVIYKPRDVTLEAGWYGLVHWLQRHGLQCAPPAPRVLARPGYGWVEAVHPEEPGDHAHFARRAGALVFLAWLLGGADLHEDNLIATSTGPTLVDAEALLQPLRSDLTAAAGSVAGTGLLTFPIVTAAGTLADAGGLVGGPRPSPLHPGWEHVNTDAMRPALTPHPSGAGRNLPRLGAQLYRPTRYVWDLEQGFAETYRFCLVHRRQLRDPEGPLVPLATACPRLVFRPTEGYVRLQRALLSPAYQRLGVERSVALDALNRHLAHLSERPPLWALAAQERQALENLDIPRFTVPATADTLTAADGSRICGVILRSGWDSLLERLRGLNEEQLAAQRRLVRLCAATQPLADEEAPVSPQEREEALGAWREALVAAADECGTEIERTAFAGHQVPQADLWTNLNPRDLFHGLPGIAVFFAALQRTTGERRFGERAVAAWRCALAHPDDTTTLGGCQGIGGRLYALSLLFSLLGDEEARAALRRHLAAFPVAAIAEDAILDVEGGAAGAILGLLATYQVLGDHLALELAQQCARHLLQCQNSDGSWVARDRTAPGFAHGAAGIACALGRLAAHTGEERLQAAAQRAFAFEVSLYDAARRKWPVAAREVTGGTRHVPMTAWCNGAPGIALALATAALPATTSAGLEEAIDATRRAGIPGLDHLCCGSLGIIDVLLTCGRRLGLEPLVRAATTRGTVVLRRAHSGGGFEIGQDAPGGVKLGLFHGLAGVGYSALRLANPDALPSVLAFLHPGGDRP